MSCAALVGFVVFVLRQNGLWLIFKFGCLAMCDGACIPGEARGSASVGRHERLISS